MGEFLVAILQRVSEVFPGSALALLTSADPETGTHQLVLKADVRTLPIQETVERRSQLRARISRELPEELAAMFRLDIRIAP